MQPDRSRVLVSPVPFLLAGLLIVLFATPAPTAIGTLDDVPGATLLLPYFEVDPDALNGVTTLFTIRNASDAPVLAHVTLWSNLAVPVLSFQIYLTGYDSQTLNLRDLFVMGRVPVTAPSDMYSPRGDRSKPHDDFGGGCSVLPYTNPAIPSFLRDHLRTSLTGEPSPVLAGECAGAATDAMVGYVTIDAANGCGPYFPSDTGYFEPGGAGVASNRNVLWGDWLIVDQANNFAQGEALVAIEASADDPLTSTPGNRTFYGRYVGGSAADNREPLPADWLASLDPAGLPAGETELLVWRDSGVVRDPFLCGPLPPPFPLATTGSTVHDAEGVATPFPADALPWETQRLTADLSGAALSLDLDATTGSVFDPVQQGHVTVLHRGSGVYSTGSGGVQDRPGALGAPDAAPGASLLLPYFEVDPADPARLGTAATIHNAAAEPVLAHAVLWTDLGIPTLGFDVLLPGRGSRTLDLGELFGTGLLPESGPATLPGCSGRLPADPLSAASLDGLRAAHAGSASGLFDDRCVGHDHGDGLARGYVTVDVVTSCSDAVPGDPGYLGLLGFDNVLWGETVHLDAATNVAHGEALVHLQASTTDLVTGTGQHTFYGRYTASSAADHREALPNRWGAAFRTGGVFEPAEHTVWRDPGVVPEPFDCALGPLPFPIGQGVSLRFDEHGFDGTVPAPAAGLATQRRTIPQPIVPAQFGWLFLDLDTWTGGPFGSRLQSHVSARARAFGRFATSSGAVHIPLTFGTAVSILATDPEAAERSFADPTIPDPGEMVIGRTGPLDQPLDVVVALSGTATEGADFASVGGTLVTIPGGVSTVAIPVDPIPDTESDDGETVTLTIEPGIGYSIGQASSATVTISERQQDPGGPPVNVLEIPALGTWGMTILVLFLFGAGIALAART